MFSLAAWSIYQVKLIITIIRQDENKTEIYTARDIAHQWVKQTKTLKKKVYSSIFKFLKNCYKNNYFYYLYQWVHVIYSIFLNIYSEEKFTDSIQILFWIQEFCVCCGGNLCRDRLLVIYFSEKFQTLLLWTSLYCAGFTLHLFSSSKSQRL